MLFLVELDHVKSGAPLSPEAGKTFVEQVIFPTLARCEEFVAEKKIVSGGAVVGRISLRFIVDADSSEHVDRIISSLPVWPLAETRVTPLITFGERRHHIEGLLKRLAAERA
jgi:muconolactone delta-isomerase